MGWQNRQSERVDGQPPRKVQPCKRGWSEDSRVHIHKRRGLNAGFAHTDAGLAVVDPARKVFGTAGKEESRLGTLAKTCTAARRDRQGADRVGRHRRCEGGVIMNRLTGPAETKGDLSVDALTPKSVALRWR